MVQYETDSIARNDEHTSVVRRASKRTRLAGLAGLLGGALWALWPLGTEVFSSTSAQETGVQAMAALAYALALLVPAALIVFGLVGLRRFHAGTDGRLGTVGTAVSVGAIALMGGGLALEGMDIALLGDFPQRYRPRGIPPRVSRAPPRGRRSASEPPAACSLDGAAPRRRHPRWTRARDPEGNDRLDARGVRPVVLDRAHDGLRPRVGRSGTPRPARRAVDGRCNRRLPVGSVTLGGLDGASALVFFTTQRPPSLSDVLTR